IAADGHSLVGPDYSNCPRLNRDVSGILARGNGGHSSYHALQLRMDSRRLLRIGLEVGANYTWSPSIDNRSVSGLSNSSAETGVGYLDAFNPSIDRGSSDFDVRHRFAAHFIWEIPFNSRLQSWEARYLLKGWELSGFLSYQTGQPFSLADFGTPDYTGERTRPRLTGALPHSLLVPDSISPNSLLFLPLGRVYDPVSGLCIADATPFACEVSVNGPFDGTLSRNAFRQPGLFFQDTALLKNFPLTGEVAKLQFRIEFYNVFNHSNLYLNSTSTDVSTSCFAHS